MAMNLRNKMRRLSFAKLLQKRRKHGIFGCDLQQLVSSEKNIPFIVHYCSEFVEQYCLIDGVYRLSGINRNILRLRAHFDANRIPDLFINDCHAITSLLKLFFRLLPNPLLTFELHDAFVEAIRAPNRFESIRRVIQQLPLCNRLTLEYLCRHLNRVSQFSSETGMNAKNLSIVWAPNLLRSKQLESGSGGIASLHIIGCHAILIEYLIVNCDRVFDPLSYATSHVIPHDTVQQWCINTPQQTCEWTRVEDVACCAVVTSIVVADELKRAHHVTVDVRRDLTESRARINAYKEKRRELLRQKFYLKMNIDIS